MEKQSAGLAVPGQNASASSVIYYEVTKMEEEQNKAEIVEEMPKTDALFDEKGQANLVKEDIENDNVDLSKIKKFISSPWFPIFCILFIALIYFLCL